MPIVRFQGFPDGETVSLSASQGAASDTVTLPLWNTSEGGASGASVSIRAVRAPLGAQYAPEVVWFYAEPSGFGLDAAPANSIAYVPEFHEIEYEWDFGDPGDQFTVPQNLLAEHRDANSAVGAQAAHVFRNPGTYTVTCTARRVTNSDPFEFVEVQSTINVTVGDMDALWDASNTVVVAPDGNFAGAPAGHQITDYEQWQQPNSWFMYLRRNDTGIPEGGPVRVLFKRGFNYDNNEDGFSHRFTGGSSRDYSLLLMDAWGTGAKPDISRTNTRSNSGKAVVWRNLHFRKDYNPDTETGAQGIIINTFSNQYALFTECDFSNAGGGLAYGGQTDDFPATHTMHDCAFYDLSSYALFHGGLAENWNGNGHKHRLACLGSSFLSAPEQPHGVSSPNGQKQGPLRGFEGEDLVVQGCEFFVRVGWTNQGNWPADGVNMTAIQP